MVQNYAEKPTTLISNSLARDSCFWNMFLSRLFLVPTIRKGEVNEMDLESFFLHAVHQIEIVVLVQDERHEPEDEQHWNKSDRDIRLQVGQSRTPETHLSA